MVCAWRDEELTTHPVHDEGNDWEFADVPFDSQFYVRASLRRSFEAICKLCCSVNVAVAEDASSFFTLALQNQTLSGSATPQWLRK